MTIPSQGLKAIHKAECFAHLKQRNANLENGRLQVLEYDMDEIEMTLPPNMALLSGRVRVNNKQDTLRKETAYRLPGMGFSRR